MTSRFLTTGGGNSTALFRDCGRRIASPRPAAAFLSTKLSQGFAKSAARDGSPALGPGSCSRPPAFRSFAHRAAPGLRRRQLSAWPGAPSTGKSGPSCDTRAAHASFDTVAARSINSGSGSVWASQRATDGLPFYPRKTFPERDSVARPFSSIPSRREADKRLDDRNGAQPPPAAGVAEKSSSPSSVRTGLGKVLPALTPHENIYTLPNLLTFSRLAAAPVIGYAILHDQHALALGLSVYAGVSDVLDGWIARHWKLQTVVGSVVDPMADKVLMTVLTVCLAAKGALPLWVAVIILGRDVALAIAAVYYRWISLPPPKTFSRYWDFSLPSAEVRPTTISKYNTFLQLSLMGVTTLAPVVAVDLAAGMTALQYIVATTTVWSGLSYVFSRDAVKILNQDQKQSQTQDKPKDL